jgi:uncharacterized protein YqhQ
MAKKEIKTTAPLPMDENGKPFSVGGQAVMEGVMMQAKDTIALAVRQPNGKIALRTKPRKLLAKKYPILGWPIIRGVVNFIVMMAVGMKTLTESAEMAGEQMEEPSKFEKKVASLLHVKAEDVMMVFAVILALVLAIGMFFVIPTALESWIRGVIPNKFAVNLIGGLVRIAIFIGYVAAVSQMKEIKRVFRYHGAEHKAVHCFEHGDELTVENAQKYTTLHPRCGTSFLFIVMAISILVFVLFGADTSNVLIRVGSRVALLPLVAGLSYEILQYLGKAGDGPIVSALKWPGLMMQKLTTAEPDDSMVEVALAALKASLKMDNPLGEQAGEETAEGEQREAEQTEGEAQPE